MPLTAPTFGVGTESGNRRMRGLGCPPASCLPGRALLCSQCPHCCFPCSSVIQLPDHSSCPPTSSVLSVPHGASLVRNELPLCPSRTAQPTEPCLGAGGSLPRGPYSTGAPGAEAFAGWARRSRKTDQLPKITKTAMGVRSPCHPSSGGLRAESSEATLER